MKRPYLYGFISMLVVLAVGIIVAGAKVLG